MSSNRKKSKGILLRKRVFQSNRKWSPWRVVRLRSREQENNYNNNNNNNQNRSNQRECEENDNYHSHHHHHLLFCYDNQNDDDHSKTHDSGDGEKPTTTTTTATMVYNFRCGGQLRVQIDALHPAARRRVVHELTVEAADYFRQYTIQNTPEPRAHFLLHARAKRDNEDAMEAESSSSVNNSTGQLQQKQQQPGFKYGATTMKARPLSSLPRVEALSKQMQVWHGNNNNNNSNLADDDDDDNDNCFWNVGVNPILYRSSQDSIGWHADDSHNESLIATAIVQCREPRPIGIRTRRCGANQKNRPGDEDFELYLQAGDIYSMNGEMQKNYVHRVAKKKIWDSTSRRSDNHDDKQDNEQGRRIVVVMRRGDEKAVDRDSGGTHACLKPRVQVPHIFGNCIVGMEEGHAYRRHELIDTYFAHRSCQGGISGTQELGCDAIVVSGRCDYGMEHDTFDTLTYAATRRQGAASLITSYKEYLPVRVYRSSALTTVYQTPPSEDGRSRYRYDGVYEIREMRIVQTCGHIPSDCSKLCVFRLQRRGHGGDGAALNRKSLKELMHFSVARGTMIKEALYSLTQPTCEPRTKRLGLQLKSLPSVVCKCAMGTEGLCAQGRKQSVPSQEIAAKTSRCRKQRPYVKFRASQSSTLFATKVPWREKENSSFPPIQPPNLAPAVKGNGLARPYTKLEIQYMRCFFQDPETVNKAVSPMHTQPQGSEIDGLLVD